MTRACWPWSRRRLGASPCAAPSASPSRPGMSIARLIFRSSSPSTRSRQRMLPCWRVSQNWKRKSADSNRDRLGWPAQQRQTNGCARQPNPRAGSNAARPITVRTETRCWSGGGAGLGQALRGCRFARLIDLDRDARLQLAGANRQRRFDMADIGRRRQIGGEEFLIRVPVMGNNLQQEIRLARQHVAFADQGPGLYQGFEGLEVMLRLTVKADMGKNSDTEAQGLGIDLGMIAAHKAGLFQGTHPTQARRRRDSCPFGQVTIGHAAIA